jgi:LysR family hydrogen peroxide-inducible transcriptional activator
MSVGALSLRDLEYVVAVAQHEHFGRAALACGVSQPALSAQIRKVEEVLGGALFERNRRRVLVTPFGFEAAAQARVVLAEAQKLFDAAAGRRELLSGAFALGVIATLGPYLMPHVLGPLRRRFPRLDLHLREGLTDALLEQLKTGALDAVLCAAPVTDPALASEPLFREPFVLALPAQHPLARKPGVAARDLRADQMLLLEEGHCLREQALDVCPRGHGRGRARLQATGLETLRHMVASGAGYSLIPALAAGPGPLGRLIRYRRLAAPVPGRTIVVVWRRHMPRAADVGALAVVVRESVPKLDA